MVGLLVALAKPDGVLPSDEAEAELAKSVTRTSACLRFAFSHPDPAR